MARMRLGEMLVRANFLKPEQLATALAEQRKWGGRLGDILIKMNGGLEEIIVRALARQLGVPWADLNAVATVPQEVLVRLPADQAQALCAMPLELTEGGRTLVVAVADPDAARTGQELQRAAGCKISMQIASRSSIARAQQRFYRSADSPPPEDNEFVLELEDSGGNQIALGSSASKQPPRRTGERPAASARPAAPSANSDGQLQELLEAQRREVATLKVLVDLMIEKGVFSREEYLAKFRRSS